MAVTKTEGGTAYPKSAYLYTPSDTPSDWKLRYRNADGEIDPRLLGACHAALTVGYRGNKVDLPDGEKAKCLARLKALYRQANVPWPDGGAQMAAHPDAFDFTDLALFALPDDETAGDAQTVVRTGLLFKAGEFTDGGGRTFAITPDELRAAVDAFNGAECELEHNYSNGIRTFLDGKIGQCTALWTSDDGTHLFGDVEVPRWLDRLWGEAGRKASAVWDTIDGAKRLVRLGLCLKPVLKDVALFAEYATFAGQRHSAGDLRDLQAIHDITTAHGALCPDQSATTVMPPLGGPLFAHAQGDTTMPEETPPTTTPATPPAAPADDSAMLARFAEMEKRITDQTAQFAADKTAMTDRITQLATENQTLMANYAAERTKRLQSEAVAFADTQIAAGKAFPYERESLATDYLIAVEDDAQRGPITFAEGQPPVSRVERLQKVYETKKPHGLTSEQMRLVGNDGAARTPSLFALPNLDTTPRSGDEETPEQAAQRRKELLAMTPLGRTASNGTTA